MAKINITLNNKNYSIEESSLSEAINALQTHLSTTMSGSGATITLDGTTYNIDSTKLSTATTEFITQLGTVAGTGHKVKVGGVEYSIGSDKVSGAIGELESVFCELSNGSSEPTLNEYGFYYNRSYTSYVEGYGNFALLYREDGTVYLISVDYAAVSETGSYTVSGNTIINNISLGAIPTVISSNGSELQYDAFGTSFVLDEFAVTDEDYIYIYDSSLGGYSVAPIDKTKSSYGAIKTGINGIDTVKLADDAFHDNAHDGNENLIIAPNIPNTVKIIGANAFYDCYKLKNVVLPNSVTTIGNRAFFGCSSLTSITIPDSVTSIGSSAFYSCGDLTEITIPDSVTTIGGHAFYDCTSLTAVTIPDSVTTIGVHTFHRCISLTSITIPNSVTAIGDYAFDECKNLTSITIPDSVTSIGSYAFANCISLTTVTIPDSVTSIGGQAFRDCTSLTSIAFDGTTAQWNAIAKGDRWNLNIPATDVQCSDGQVAL